MKSKVLNPLCAVGLSFAMSFGSLGCMVTALKLGDSLALVALICLLAAAVTALCFSLRRITKLLPILWLCWLPVVFFPGSPFLAQGKDLLRAMMTIYGKAYGFQLSPNLLNAAADSHALPLLMLAAMISLGVCWAVQRQCSPILAYFTCALPMAACIVVTDTVPSLTMLLLWLLGVILLGLSHKVRLRNRSQADRLTLLLTIPVALGLWLLALAVPQKGYSPPLNMDFQRLADWFTDQFGRVEYIEGPGTSGPIKLSDRVDLSTANGQPNNTNTVMQLKAEFSGTVYLKGRDYDLYNGMEWISDPNREESAFLSYRWLTHQGQLTVTTEQIYQNEFVPYYADVGYIFQGGFVENATKSNYFTYSCYDLRPDWIARWQQSYGNSLPSVDYRYFALPEDTARAAQQILRRINLPADCDPVTKALSIGQFVQNSAVYDLTPQRIPADTKDFAIWFLNNAKSGYCVHFATSATVLLRAAGIPARYVEGYMVEVTEGQTTAVQGKMAHAWVEMYVNGVGWIILDPTPSDDTEPPLPTEPTTEPTTAPTTRPTRPTEPTTEPSEPTIEPPTEPSTTVPGVTTPSETNPNPPTAPTELPTIPSDAPAVTKESMPLWAVIALVSLNGVALIASGITAQWYLRRKHKKKRMNHGPAKARALALYRESQRICRKLGQQLPKLLQELAEKACFSQYELTEQELAQFSAFLREGTNQLKKRSFFRRLAYRFIYAFY